MEEPTNATPAVEEPRTILTPQPGSGWWLLKVYSDDDSKFYSPQLGLVKVSQRMHDQVKAAQAFFESQAGMSDPTTITFSDEMFTLLDSNGLDTQPLIDYWEETYGENGVCCWCDNFEDIDDAALEVAPFDVVPHVFVDDSWEFEPLTLRVHIWKTGYAVDFHGDVSNKYHYVRLHTTELTATELLSSVAKPFAL